ncbi:MAG: hypothetical protein ACOC28_01860 [Alkalispirochaetaceae bacterium]
MRQFLAALLVGATFALVTLVDWEYGAKLDPFTFDYIARNFYEDTASKNGVASILLNYRMYDTMFEALILLTAIIGMSQFLPGNEPGGRDEKEERDE